MPPFQSLFENFEIRMSDSNLLRSKKTMTKRKCSACDTSQAIVLPLGPDKRKRPANGTRKRIFRFIPPHQFRKLDRPRQSFKERTERFIMFLDFDGNAWTS